jgi:hypothetical protein
VAELIDGEPDTEPVELEPDTVPRWHPDDQLIAAVLAGPGYRTMAALSPADRCWVVAGLRIAGLTAEQTRDRLKPCSLRLVRSILAEPMTTMAIRYQLETAHFADEMRLARSEFRHVTKQLMDAAGELDRTKRQLDRMITARATGARPCRTCGTPLDRYNAYEHSGKLHCRTCHRNREQRRRDAKRAGMLTPVSTDCQDSLSM